MKKLLILISVSIGLSIYSQEYKSLNDSLFQTSQEKVQEEKYTEALNILSKISSFSSDRNKAVIEKTQVYYYQKKYEDAKKEMLKLDKNSLDTSELIDYYTILGNIYDELKEKEKSIETYNEALKIFPNSYLLHYNRAVTYINLDKYAEAYQDLQKTIEIYPLFAKAHYLIGLLASDNGRHSEATLALTTSAILDESGNLTENAISHLNKLLSSKYEEPENPFVMQGSENFDNIEGVLRKQYALNKDYKLKSEFDLPYVRQLQALVSELPKISARNNFYLEKYADFYSQVWKEDQFENLSYFIFKNHGNENIQKLLSKKSNDLNKFKSWVIPKLFETVLTTKNPYSPNKEVVSVVSDDGYIGYGKRVNDKKEGRWTYYFPSGNKALEVDIANNLFNGKGTLYTEDGKIAGKLNYKNGELEGPAEYYYENGNVKSKKNFLQGNENNKQEYYYLLGGLKCRGNIANKERNGLEECFYANGTKKSLFNYVNGLAQGEGSEFYPDGSPKFKAVYAKNYYEGEKKEFFPNGKITSSEIYKAGVPAGDFKLYAANGDLLSLATFSNGKITGLKKYIAKNLVEERFYTNDRIVKQIEYISDKPFVEFAFDGKSGKERISSYKYFDEKGNPSQEFKIDNNKAFKVNLAGGKLYLEGKYNDKGLKDGEWKYYNTVTGNLEYLTFFENDVQVKKYEDFYPNGQLKSSFALKDGKKQGPYTTYFQNGKVSFETNYINDQENGEVKTYNKEGKIKSTYFLVDGILEGIFENYDSNGVLADRSEYSEGEQTKIDYYYNGKLVSSIDFNKPGKTSFFAKNGKEFTEATISNGKFEGSYILKNTKNQKIFEGNLIDGKKFGVSSSYNPNGSIAIKTNNKNGESDGEYLGYNLEGKNFTKSTYANGVEFGTYERYFPDGGFMYIKTDYFEDKKHGKETFFGSNGEEIVSLIFHNGNLISYKKVNDAAPTLVEKGNANITANYKNGKPALNITYKNGELNGSYTYYAENGNPLVNTNYVNGLLEGTRTINYLNGNVYYSENFKNGDFSGSRKVFYANGKPKIEANYLLDYLHGTYVEYDEQGKVIENKKYEDDVLVEIK